MAAWARSFSSGRYAASDSVVLPVNRKFQPTPSKNSAMVNWCSSTPLSAIAIHNRFSNTPTPMMVRVPKRLIKWPVKKPGANMPITCHSSTKAASSKPRPHCCMANGVAAMSRFMTPYPSAALTAATINAGCRAISHSGRPRTVWAVGAWCAGNCTNAMSTMANKATPANTTYAPANGTSSKVRVRAAKLGPATAPIKPPASTSDTAFSRNAGSASSAAAKR